MGLSRLLIILVTGVLPFLTMAQNDGLTITERKAQFKVMVNFDFRRTWVNADPVGFYGFRIGAQKNKDVIALGFYGLSTPYVQQDIDLDELGEREVRTNFDFTTITYERILLETRRWQLGIPIGVGLGNYRTSYRDDDGSFRAYTKNELLPVDLSLYLNYKITWWGFIGVGGGYRYVYAKDDRISTSLSNWTWFAKAGLRFGAIYKKIIGTEE